MSDFIGRRRTAVASVAVLVVATLVFLFADSTAALYVACILSGLGIGILSMRGLPNLSAVNTRHMPPLHLSFVVYFAILCAVAILVWFSRERVHYDMEHFSCR